MHLYKQEKLITVKSVIVSITVFLCVVVICLITTGNLSKNTQQNEINTLQEALDNAALVCYSVEGNYPENIEYLEENYGIIYDHDKYWVSYSIFGSNLRPEIIVYKY